MALAQLVSYLVYDAPTDRVQGRVPGEGFGGE